VVVYQNHNYSFYFNNINTHKLITGIGSQI